jgi:hypothetical protein
LLTVYGNANPRSVQRSRGLALSLSKGSKFKER